MVRPPSNANRMNNERSLPLPGASPPTEYELNQSNLSLLRAELNLTVQERDTLRLQLEKFKMLRTASDGGDGMDLAMSPRLDRQSFHNDYDYLKVQCERTMSELQALKTRHGDTARKCDTAVKEGDYYRNKHRTALQDIQQLQSEVYELSSRLNAMMTEKQQLELEVGNVQRTRDSERRELNELRQLYRENRMYDPEDQMNDLALIERDNIQQHYNELSSKYSQSLEMHADAVNKYEITEKENARLKRLAEDSVHEKNRVVVERNGIKQQLASVNRQWETTLREKNEARENCNKAQIQRDQTLAEMNQLKTTRWKINTDLVRLTEERNSALQEYTLIMSERDTVHKEMEKQQDDLLSALKQITSIEAEKKTAFNELETLRREISSALSDRDKAIKECHDLREKVAIIEKDSQRTFDSSKFAAEIESMQHQVEKHKAEVAEAQREAEIFKSRRDWAFKERDKIVLERESVKILCDNLRRERDKAVGELTEALRDGDELKKQYIHSLKESQDLREKLDHRSNRDARIRHLHNNQHNESRDSAIDADFASDVLSETLEVDFDTEPSKLGFDVSGGVDDPTCPTAIYVSHVMKGSAAEGKLQVSDCVLRVNNVDVHNVDRKTVLHILHSSSGTLNLVIRRRRSLKVIPKFMAFHFQVPPPSNTGLSLATGIFVSRLAPASPLKEAGLCIGDRITHLAGECVSDKTSDEVMRILEHCENHTVLMNVMRHVASSPTLGTDLGHYGSDTSDSEKVSSNGRSFTIPGSPVRPASKSVEVQTDPSEFARNDSTLRQKRSADSKERIPWNSLFVSKDRVRPRLDNVFPIDTKSHTTVKTTRMPSNSKEPKGNLLDRAYDKIFRRDRKEPRPTIEHIPNSDENSVIAQLESVVEFYQSPHGSRSSTKTKVEKVQKMPGGTWPKYRGPPLDSEENIESSENKSSPKEANRKSVMSLTMNAHRTPWICTDIPIDDFDVAASSPSMGPPAPATNPSYRNHRFSMPPVYDVSPVSRHPRLSMYPESIDMDTASVTSSLDFIPPPNPNRVMQIPPRRQYRDVPNPMMMSPQLPGLPMRVMSPNIYDTVRSRARITSGSMQNAALSLPPSDEEWYMGNYGDTMKRPMSLGVSNRSNQWVENNYASPRMHSGGPQHIYTPSNQSMSSKSSLSHMSAQSGSIDRNSPMTPMMRGSPFEHRGSSSPMMPFTLRKRPQLGEQRIVSLECNNEQPGFKIGCHEMKIFVSSVTEKSMADLAGVTVGDQVLDAGGINLRSSDYETAKKTLMALAKGCLKMTLQYRGPYPSSSNSSSLQSPVSGSAMTSSDSLKGPTGTLKGTPFEKRDKKGHNGTLSPKSGVHEARFFKATKGLTDPLGVNLIGGSVHGIFVHHVQPNTVATGPKGLNCGDQILEYNDINMRNPLLEKAMFELCKPVQNVKMIVQYNPEKYEEAISTAGDALFVRAMWDRDKSQLQDEDLMFQKGDILFIDSTLYNGEIGLWRAWLLDENAKPVECGIIPNRYKAEEEVLNLQQSSSDLDIDPNRRSARRSFFKKRKNPRQGGRELASFSNSSLGTETFSVAPEEPLVPTYQRVEKLVYEDCRPVLILGPLADMLMEKLLQTYPQRFTRCPAYSHVEEPSMDDPDVVDYRQMSGLWESVTIKSIKEVAERNMHCLLDIRINFVEKIQSFNIHPIILLIKYKSPNLIREVRDGLYGSAKISSKAAKDLFDFASRLEIENGKMITEIIPGGTNVAYMATLACSVIETAQTKPQWVPLGPVS